MFKKKPNIKPLAPLRSSDRRRTADQIIKDLDIAIPNEDSEDPEVKAIATQERSYLRNSLLPDNALSARFTTTHGPQLKQVSGTVYVGSHEGDEQRVLWVSLDGRMYPTVYTLWRNPGILPLLLCGSMVVDKIKGGADLMIPGLLNGPPFPQKAKKGAIVAISGHDRPSVPVAVGTCDIDVSALQEVRGVKGQAVEMFHWSGDDIWSWNASGKPGGEPPDHLDGWLLGDADMAGLQKQAGELDLEDVEEEGGVALSSGDTSHGDAKSDDQTPGKDFTTQEIDDAFKNAFLYGVNHFKSSNPKTKNFGLDFPLTQTIVMSTLVNPFLPAYTPHEAAQLQIKKSSWKNIKKFIKYLDKQHIVKSKDRDSHEAVILDIDFDDRSVLAFTPYRLPKKDAPATTGQSSAASQSETSGDPSIGQTLKCLSLYRPKEKLSELFSAAKAEQKAFYTAAEVKSAVGAYIEGEELISPTNKRIVKLNPYLANSVFDNSKGALDKEVLAKGTVPRDMLAERVLASCAPFHLIVRNNDNSVDTNTQKPKAGAPPKVTVTLETRSGNKTVTKIHGLETYFIPPQPLADELRKACAGSTSVERLAASSPKNPIMEVMVQGPQGEAVVKALERRGVDRRWVDVVDKTKGKKKG